MKFDKNVVFYTESFIPNEPDVEWYGIEIKDEEEQK